MPTCTDEIPSVSRIAPPGPETWTVFADSAWDPRFGLQRDVRISASDGHIVENLHNTSRRRADVYLPGAIAVPALCNGHDHLKYHWPNRVGGMRFTSSYDWIPLLQEEAHMSFLRTLPVADLYWLGALASISAGVGTVLNHAHNPMILEQRLLPIRMPNDFRRELMVDLRRNSVIWEHRMGQGAVLESKRALAEGRPFVVHIAEGIDVASANEVASLAHSGALHEHCILVHAINLSDHEIGLIADAHASVVWCPASNLYLFGQTAPIMKLLDAGVNVLLGTDSPCSGSESLRDEIRVACDFLVNQAGLAAEVAAETCIRMATEAFSEAYPGLGVGSLAVGASADVLLLSPAGDHESELVSIAAGSWDVVLLTVGGRGVVLPREWAANGLIPRWFGPTSAVARRESEMVIAGDPRDLIERVTAATNISPDMLPLFNILFPQNRRYQSTEN